MKTITLILLILFFGGSFYSQDKAKTEPQTLSFDVNGADGCGNPLAESQLYALWRGKVIKIISANKVVFVQGGREYIVNLVGIGADFNEKNIKTFLKEKILNQQVEISYANLRKESDRKFGGVLLLLNDNEDIDEINEYLLENGIAKFKDFDSDNLVPYYFPCRLRKAEERAKEAKLGIWAK